MFNVKFVDNMNRLKLSNNHIKNHRGVCSKTKQKITALSIALILIRACLVVYYPDFISKHKTKYDHF